MPSGSLSKISRLLSISVAHFLLEIGHVETEVLPSPPPYFPVPLLHHLYEDWGRLRDISPLYTLSSPRLLSHILQNLNPDTHHISPFRVVSVSSSRISCIPLTLYPAPRPLVPRADAPIMSRQGGPIGAGTGRFRFPSLLDLPAPLRLDCKKVYTYNLASRMQTAKQKQAKPSTSSIRRSKLIATSIPDDFTLFDIFGKR